jgi:DNA polymerase II small subunit
MMQIDLKKEIIQSLMAKDVLVTEEIIERLDSLNAVSDEDLLEELRQDNTLIMNENFISKLRKTPSQKYEWNVTELPQHQEKKEVELEKPIAPVLDEHSNVQVVYNYSGLPKKRDVRDFSLLFKKRYYAVLNLLRGRKELANIVSISRLQGKAEKESVGFVGMVSEKSTTSNGHIMLTMEDDTGTIKVLISKNNTELFPLGDDVVLDEIVGIAGTMGENIVFANALLYPDVPLSKELKKSPIEEYALFISDLHFGSKYFLQKEWNKFIKWMNGEVGKESHKEVIDKIRYLIIGGDIIDGVGIYPGQDQDQDIADIYGQYEAFTKELKKLPKHLKVVIIPGNHDAVRVADPQPPIPEKYAPELYAMDNVYMLSSPSIVNIGKTKNFSGLDLLLYHGYSFTYFADTVPSIRDNGGMTRADLVLKFYLQRRHLGITHGALQYVPDSHDALFISQVPDILVTGHVHRTMADTYRNVTILNCSTWLAMTDFQEKVGLEPQPARAILLNMKTRGIKILNFSEKKKEENEQETTTDTKEQQGVEA